MIRLCMLCLCMVHCMLIMAKTDSLSVYFKLNKANELAEQGDVAGALEGYSDALEEAQNDPAIYYNLGHLYYQNGQMKEARKTFEQALKSSDPSASSEVHYALGNVAYQMGDFQDSVKEFSRVLSLDPTDIDAKINLELALNQLKQSQQQQNDDQEETDDTESENSEDDSMDPSDENDSTDDDSQNQQEESDKNEPDMNEQQQNPLDNLLNSLDQLEKDARDQFLNQHSDDEQNVEYDW